MPKQFAEWLDSTLPQTIISRIILSMWYQFTYQCYWIPLKRWVITCLNLASTHSHPLLVPMHCKGLAAWLFIHRLGQPHQLLPPHRNASKSFTKWIKTYLWRSTRKKVICKLLVYRLSRLVWWSVRDQLSDSFSVCYRVAIYQPTISHSSCFIFL